MFCKVETEEREIVVQEIAYLDTKGEENEEGLVLDSLQ